MSRESIRCGTVPKNLAELMKGSQEGYAMAPAYCLELEHGLWGYFPAIFRGTKRIVVTLDEDLIKEVWKLLSPRRSKMETITLMANKEIGIGYPIQGSTPRDNESSEPQEILTRKEFEEFKLLSDTPVAHRFEWAPGLIGGNGMTQEEFLRTVEAAQAQI